MSSTWAQLQITEQDGGARIGVKVVPGSSRDRIVGCHGELLRATVTAPPERGRANAALCRLLASALGVPVTAVTVVAGAASPHKQVLVRGLTAAELRRRLPA